MWQSNIGGPVNPWERKIDLGLELTPKLIWFHSWQIELLGALQPTIITVTSLTSGDNVQLAWSEWAKLTANALGFLRDNWPEGANRPSFWWHTTWLWRTVEEMAGVLSDYRSWWADWFLALRWDKPSGNDYTTFPYARDLVEFMSKHNIPPESIAVAWFPQGHIDSKETLANQVLKLKDKLEAWAQWVFTQHCLDYAALEGFFNLCSQKNIPLESIRVWFMPQWKNLNRYLEWAKEEGIIIPESVINELAASYVWTGDSYEAKGATIIAELIHKIREKVWYNKFVIYTGNNLWMTNRIWQELGIVK